MVMGKQQIHILLSLAAITILLSGCVASWQTVGPGGEVRSGARCMQVGSDGDERCEDYVEGESDRLVGKRNIVYTCCSTDRSRTPMCSLPSGGQKGLACQCQMRNPYNGLPYIAQGQACQ